MNHQPGKKQPAHRWGFTLIELLIVIAIILILIAIALPNFLEAQIRAKVARVKAELRTVATAVESYRTANTHYCYPTQRGMQIAITVTRKQEIEYIVKGMHCGYGSVPEELTTPIGYLPKALEDFFKYGSFGVTADSGVDVPFGHPWRRYSYATREAVSKDAAATFFPFNPEVHTAQRRDEFKNKQWLALSLGPDHREDMLSPYNPMVEYSPTNGTVSRGDISIVGP